jgi:hypothetical protein
MSGVLDSLYTHFVSTTKNKDERKRS